MQPIKLSEYQTSYTLNAEHTSFIGGSLETIGRILTAPGAMFISNGLRLVRKIEPLVHGQKETYNKELLNRIWLLFNTISLLLVNLIFFPIELLGAGMRLTATHFFRKTCVFIQPKIKAIAKEVLENKSNSLGLCSFNIAAMPSFIADRNGLERMDTRAKKIAQQIKEMPDEIICIQEGFENFKDIAKELQRKFPDINILYDVANNHPLRFGSGLVLISKHPITNFQFWEHPNVGGDEVLASKGVLIATIELPNKQHAIIVNTHLNGGAPKSEKFSRGGCDYRSDQLRHVKERTAAYMADFQAQYPGEHPYLFFAGDFNIGPTKPSGEKGLVPAIDDEWIYRAGDRQSGQSSFFNDLMDPEEYDRTTAKYLEMKGGEPLKEKVNMIAKESLSPKQFINGINYSSFNMEEPGAGFDRAPDRWLLKAEFVDHIFKGNPNTFPGILQTQLDSQVISLENGVSDHTVNHVKYTLK